MFDSVKTKSRRLLNQPTEPRVLKLDFSWLKRWFAVRKPKFSALVIGVVLTWVLSSLVQTYYPAQLRDLLIPGSYLIPLTLLWLLQLYLYSFVFLSSGRAFVLSIGVCWLVWLKLHQFALDFGTIAATLGCVLLGILVTGKKIKPV